ncbi:beta-glucosidase 24-like [Telopea speciosissima]|uniref:beta-glucosidase 24-like n=1 Tax=Telopea speciosissima TaxID=54955 RepID=UPI001CC35318|nr:beta-glucosidase 24-like [Telopea speciosissima]
MLKVHQNAISNGTNGTNTTRPMKRSEFPNDFYFGAASSAYQYEGAATEGGKGVSNWDHHTHRNPDKIKDGKNGDVTVDFYHRYPEDVAAMADLGFNGFRLSIAWTRIIPTGKKSNGVNEEGIQYYKDLIKELHGQGIEPFVTLFHWDVPQALEDEYGGFMNSKIIDDFRDYANICFDQFGYDVRHWITLNEPFEFTTFGYVDGTFPGTLEDLGTIPYTVGHNMLCAHAAIVDLYRNNYQKSQGGKIGITLSIKWMVPLSNEHTDVEAAARANDFQFGWFMDPVTFGDYPSSMQHLVRDRLPKFSPKESLILKGSYDFLGVNYYTAKYVTHAPYSPLELLKLQTGSEWVHVYARGIQDVLLSIKEKYNGPVIYITENGIAQHSSLTMDESLNDVQRVQALNDHLFYIKCAMDAGVDVKGYFVWSLLDNFEWRLGYTERFGIYYVNFNKEHLQRNPKNSAKWFRKFLSE